MSLEDVSPDKRMNITKKNKNIKLKLQQNVQYEEKYAHFLSPIKYKVHYK